MTTAARLRLNATTPTVRNFYRAPRHIRIGRRDANLIAVGYHIATTTEPELDQPKVRPG